MRRELAPALSGWAAGRTGSCRPAAPAGVTARRALLVRPAQQPFDDLPCPEQSWHLILPLCKVGAWLAAILTGQHAALGK